MFSWEFCKIYRTPLGDCFCRKVAQEVFSKITPLNIKDNYPKRIVIESFHEWSCKSKKTLLQPYILRNFRNFKNSCFMAHLPEACNLSFFYLAFNQQPMHALKLTFNQQPNSCFKPRTKALPSRY